MFRSSGTWSSYVSRATLAACLVPAAGSAASEDPPGPSPAPVRVAGSENDARIERLERLVTTVVEENRRLAEEVRTLKDQLGKATPPLPSPSPPDPAVGAPAEIEPAIEVESPATIPSPEPSESAGSVLGIESSRFRVDYDNGFSIIPEDLEKTPFSLRVRNQNMFRYNGFDRSERFWTDSAGNRVPIDSSNYFGIPRGRLIFSGAMLDPDIRYLLSIDYNTVTSNPIGFRAYEFGYRFDRAFELYVGQAKVLGSREWLESAFAPLQGPDRSMATTFFRPSLSQGVWILGQPTDHLYYRAMMSNGFNTLNLQPQSLNNRFAWSGSVWWEPWGSYGRGYADVQNREEAAIRLGASYVFARGRGSQNDSDAVENSPVRLSDGTIITVPGAIAPGVTLQTYDISLASIDLSYKYRGLGLSTEFYFQDLLAFAGTGPLPIRSTRALGGFLQGGYFVIPEKAELYLRGSFVTGAFGSGDELGGGFNWYPLTGRENLRFTFDAARLETSPAGQNRTGYVAGQTGLLIRTQVSVFF
ncbi:MAG: hypothetical protein SFX72_22380 [Isosphaeraceae bacterium]|nr:hypothetical protein [Isosphaeraceae bacterium]